MDSIKLLAVLGLMGGSFYAGHRFEIPNAPANERIEYAAHDSPLWPARFVVFTAYNRLFQAMQVYQHEPIPPEMMHGIETSVIEAWANYDTEALRFYAKRSE